uniref:Ribonuclease S-6 n=1 Tax=Nicotiana alata TaxID=4087 RepID=RNS6_NICAL|nr:RecName: Full=Ribonuclease S-6; AltName: Full=S6-RNase; AltName: Full=Stylar glycoprotein 6; Flags: Precursor [Nicotiana alata]
MFNLPLTSVFVIFLFALSPIYGAFEYMQLVLQWPTAFCHTTPCKNIPSNFTIHGLWPDNVSTTLNFCGKEDDYNIIMDGPEKNGLYVRWPDLIREKADCMKTQNFWRREYIKHGTCCSEIYNQVQYFRLAMALKDKFDLLTSLKNHGIIRGYKYTVQKINNTIKTVTKGYPNLSCTKGQELWFVGICFDSTAKNVIDCPNPKTCKTASNQGIMFP